MPEYYSPGVYIEEKSTLGNSVVPVPTAVPAFVGYTEIAQRLVADDLIGKPIAITSMLEYQAYFGGPSLPRFTVKLGKSGVFTVQDISCELPFQMYYALQLYFANGGSIAWIVSIAKSSNDPTKYPIYADYKTGLDALERIPEVTLMYFPDQLGVESGTRYNVLVDALAVCQLRKDRFLVMDADVAAVSAFRTAIGTANLQWGAAYTPDLKTPFLQQVRDDNVCFARNGAFVDPGVTAIIAEKTLDKVILKKVTTQNVAEIVTDLWLANLRNALAGFGTATVHPGGAALGAMATTDNSRGVWNAPANVALNAVAGPAEMINDAAQSELNVPSDGSGKSINAIRQFAGRGTLVWGARTLDGNSNDWRYIQVRRTLIYIEQSLKNALQQMVFEPNDASTWAKVRSMTEAFLSNVWREGGLAGAKSDDAFAVQCGLGLSMTTDDILNGRLIVNIALAVTRPAEYIFITLTQLISS
jgi:uncharacterized protein